MRAPVCRAHADAEAGREATVCVQDSGTNSVLRNVSLNTGEVSEGWLFFLKTGVISKGFRLAGDYGTSPPRVRRVAQCIGCRTRQAT